MLKKITAQFLLATVLLLLTCSDLFAQNVSVTDTRVRFQKGRTSTTITGRIGGNGAIRNFILGAKSGQNLCATVSSRNGSVYFEGYSDDKTSLCFTTSSGDNSVSIENLARSATSFTLTISIR